MREPGADDEAWNPRNAAAEPSRDARVRYAEERDRLDRIREAAVFGMPSWERHPKVRGRSGTVEIPVYVSPYVLLGPDPR